MTTTAPTEVPQWHHDPARGRAVDHNVSYFKQKDGSSSETCFVCWCYECGGATNLPRNTGRGRTPGNETDLDAAAVEAFRANPTDHRWCFE